MVATIMSVVLLLALNALFYWAGKLEGRREGYSAGYGRTKEFSH